MKAYLAYWNNGLEYDFDKRLMGVFTSHESAVDACLLGFKMNPNYDKDYGTVEEWGVPGYVADKVTYVRKPR